MFKYVLAHAIGADSRNSEIDDLEEKLLSSERRIKQAMQITYILLENSADNRLVAKEEEIEYFDWLDETLEKQLKILKGEDSND